MCKKPFGILRLRIVEFLAQAFQVFSSEIHPVFVESGIYNKLLFFFEHYPFHNILHAKVAEIFTTAFEKQDEKILTYILDDSDLIKKILDISNQSEVYEFESGNTMIRGYVAFITQIANKIVEI